jgi:hypothetical protein
MLEEIDYEPQSVRRHLSIGIENQYELAAGERHSAIEPGGMSGIARIPDDAHLGKLARDSFWSSVRRGIIENDHFDILERRRLNRRQTSARVAPPIPGNREHGEPRVSPATCRGDHLAAARSDPASEARSRLR